jgi:hypothetical protein
MDRNEFLPMHRKILKCVSLYESEWIAWLWVDINANDVEASVGISARRPAGTAEQVEQERLSQIKFLLLQYMKKSGPREAGTSPGPIG